MHDDLFVVIWAVPAAVAAQVFSSKTAALIKMLQNNEVPLRAGVKQVRCEE